MEGYFYHGVGDSIYGLTNMIKVINDQKLLARDNDERKLGDAFNHVCLYKKNPNGDYESELWFLKSARGGWIDHCFGFIVYPNIMAQKVKEGLFAGFDENNVPISNLIDEWRSTGEILLENIAGVFLSYKTIEEYKKNPNSFEYTDSDIDLIIEFILKFATERGWIIANSDEPNFTDVLDETYSTRKSK